MTKLTKKMHNAETGEETIVELTNAEIAELELEGLATEQAKEQQAAAASSAITKLEAIGLTADEIAALRG